MLVTRRDEDVNCARHWPYGILVAMVTFLGYVRSYPSTQLEKSNNILEDARAFAHTVRGEAYGR